MLGRLLLLVVEDDVARRDLFRNALSLADFAVHACEDGLDALHYLDQARPDVIVLDVDLSRVSGTVLYDEIRARRGAERVPVVVVTGLSDPPDLGDATILFAPVTPEGLIRVIESVIVQRDHEWLFARGTQSVLISRAAEPGPNVRLRVCGPGQAVAVYEGPDLLECLMRKSAIERTLGTDGYQLLATERRIGQERRTQSRDVPDRRRDLSELSV